MNKSLQAHYNRIRRAKEALDRMKVCPRCGLKKPLTEFGRNGDSKDGFRNQCKSCTTAYNRKDREQETTHKAITDFLQRYPAPTHVVPTNQAAVTRGKASAGADLQ